MWDELAHTGEPPAVTRVWSVDRVMPSQSLIGKLYNLVKRGGAPV
jgi:hypothetical protein